MWGKRPGNVSGIDSDHRERDKLFSTPGFHDLSRQEMLGSLFYILFLFVFALPPDTESYASEPDSAASSPQPSAIAGENVATMLADDGGYLFRSLYRDGVDLIKLPLRVT